MGIKDDILNFYKDGDMMNKIIFINLAVFLFIGLGSEMLKLFNVDTSWLEYIMLPSGFMTFICRPWTLITYMFLHFNFIHIIINMLMFHWFGRLFLVYFSQKDLVGTYVLGGLCGGLFYIFSYAVFPMLSNQNGYLCGASASIMAVTVALATTAPNYQVRLMFIGDVKLKWIAIAAIVFSLLNVASENAGGNLSHIGGALAGFVFSYFYSKGTNITLWINKFIDFCVNLFRGSLNFKVLRGEKKGYTSGDFSDKYRGSYSRTTSDEEYNLRKKKDEEIIDNILDKIKKNGYESLSKEEKEKLFSAGSRK